MSKVSKANQRIAAAHNRAQVVKLLQQKRQLSRRQLAEMLGLQNSTLSYIVKELLNKKVLRVSGKAESKTVGQKQILLEMNPNRGLTAGVYVRSTGSSMVMMNAAGKLVDVIEIDVPEDLRDLPQMLRGKVDDYFGDRSRLKKKFMGVGVGLPGVVNAQTGVVLHMDDYQLREYPLGEKLKEVFPDQTISVQHDTDAAAFAEHTMGAASDLSDFLYITIIVEKVKAGYAFKAYGSTIYHNHAIYKGTHHAAGEISTKILPQYTKVISEDHLKQFGNPDGEIGHTLTAYAHSLLDSFAILANFIDPAAIVLGANFPLNNKLFLDVLNKHFADVLFDVPKRQIGIRYSQFQEHAISIGAAMYATERALVGLSTKDLIPEGQETGGMHLTI
ncbi:ROK family transcriptional regulator [Poriferisphaera sp. WC338]|uniref:ROK family transcriptional regulator n=1 Tax=Poriferisphaera sp. WC338 TaxID=3425129 RepID=UPI003D8168F3